MKSEKNTTNFTCLNPLDQRVLWAGSVSTPDRVRTVMQKSHVTSRSWRTVPIERRIEIVRRYGELLKTNADAFATLISDETGKLVPDAKGEVNASIAKCELSIRAIKERRGKQVVDQSTSQRNQQTVHVDRQLSFTPLGVAVVLGPFNFPLHLPGGQIIPAILAGNTVVFKPSELATAVGAKMVETWHQAGLPEDVLSMIVGGPDVAIEAIDSEHTSAVFLTGSRQAGLAIHRQLAGRPEVLLALELGGNNPIVIDENVPVPDVADVVSFSAYVSAGQRCTCARRAIFIEGPDTGAQIAALIEKTKTIHAGYPGDDPAPHIGRLISEHAASRLQRTYQELLDLGCTPMVPLSRDPDRPDIVQPIIVAADSLPEKAIDRIGEMEWFGPLLVIQRVPNFEEAISMASRTPYGLSAALMSHSRERFDRFQASVAAGVINWNSPTTGAAGLLPFGGRGESGNHRAAGFHAIDFCSDPIASIEATQVASENLWASVT